MTDSDGPLDTISALRSLGFTEEACDSGYLSGAICYDFGNIVLSARQCMSPRAFAEVVLVIGNRTTPNVIEMIDFEMPTSVESLDQAKAWIVWHLTKDTNARWEAKYEDATYYRLENYPPWFPEGARCFDLLPWVAERIALLRAYKERDRCRVERDWLRQALRDLREAVSALDETETVQFDFDGEIFKIQCGERRIAMAGSGQAWRGPVSVTAASLQRLPRRLMVEIVEVYFLGDYLHIDRHIYPAEQKTG